MLTLAPTVFDFDGGVTLRENPAASDFAGQSRRVSRTATLDGGAVLADYGYTDADRTLQIMVDVITPEQWAALKRLIREHAMLTLACREGVFLGAVQSMGQSEGGVTLTFLPTEKLM